MVRLNWPLLLPVSDWCGGRQCWSGFGYFTWTCSHWYPNPLLHKYYIWCHNRAVGEDRRRHHRADTAGKVLGNMLFHIILTHRDQSLLVNTPRKHVMNGSVSFRKINPWLCPWNLANSPALFLSSQVYLMAIHEHSGPAGQLPRLARET